jgi:hypothetical protein
MRKDEAEQEYQQRKQNQAKEDQEVGRLIRALDEKWPENEGFDWRIERVYEPGYHRYCVEIWSSETKENISLRAASIKGVLRKALNE